MDTLAGPAVVADVECRLGEGVVGAVPAELRLLQHEALLVLDLPGRESELDAIFVQHHVQAVLAVQKVEQDVGRIGVGVLAGAAPAEVQRTVGAVAVAVVVVHEGAQRGALGGVASAGIGGPVGPDRRLGVAAGTGGVLVAGPFGGIPGAAHERRVTPAAPAALENGGVHEAVGVAEGLRDAPAIVRVPVVALLVLVTPAADLAGLPRPVAPVAGVRGGGLAARANEARAQGGGVQQAQCGHGRFPFLTVLGLLLRLAVQRGTEMNLS